MSLLLDISFQHLDLAERSFFWRWFPPEDPLAGTRPVPKPGQQGHEWEHSSHPMSRDRDICLAHGPMRWVEKIPWVGACGS